MPELAFRTIDAKVANDSAIPAIAIRLEITNSAADETIQSILLRSQVQIEAPRRRYSKSEEAGLKDLFGNPEQWSRSLRPLLWANTTNVVGSFDRSTVVDVMIPCTIDFHAAVSGYFLALEDRTVPLTLLFSGTIFYQTSAHSLQAAPISWDNEAKCLFPIPLWKECLEAHYANTVWLPIRRDLYERLRELRAQQGWTSIDEVIERMITGTREVAA